MKPSPPTPEQRAAVAKRLAEEEREVRVIAQLPRAMRRAAVRQTAAYRRSRRRTRPFRRAFNGWSAGAFRPYCRSVKP